jgi:hypothetical protein
VLHLWVPQTFWISLTNILLGGAVILCVLVIVLGLIGGSLRLLRKRRSYQAELDRDLEEIFGTPHPRPAPVSLRGNLAAVIATQRRWHPFHRRR